MPHSERACLIRHLRPDRVPGSHGSAVARRPHRPGRPPTSRLPAESLALPFRPRRTEPVRHRARRRRSPGSGRPGDNGGAARVELHGRGQQRRRHAAPACWGDGRRRHAPGLVDAGQVVEDGARTAGGWTLPAQPPSGSAYPRESMHFWAPQGSGGSGLLAVATDGVSPRSGPRIRFAPLRRAVPVRRVKPLRPWRRWPPPLEFPAFSAVEDHAKGRWLGHLGT